MKEYSRTSVKTISKASQKKGYKFTRKNSRGKTLYCIKGANPLLSSLARKCKRRLCISLTRLDNKKERDGVADAGRPLFVWRS